MNVDDTSIDFAVPSHGDLEANVTAKLENVNICLRVNKLRMIIGSCRELQTQKDSSIYK